MAAIKMLEKADMAKFSSIFFRHAKALFTRAPVETADSFLRRYKDGLDPEKLLPAMIYVVKEIEERRRKRERKKGRQQKGGGEANPMGAPPPGLQEENSSEEEGGSEEEEEEGSEQEVEEEGEGETEEMAAEQQEGIVKYLEGAVKLGCNSVAVHNFLVTVYVGLQDELPLDRYLISVLADKNEYSVDKSFALRCTLKSLRHHRSAVKLYMAMGMQKEAVELALKVDPKLARELAKGGKGSERKRLWLMIAKSAAVRGNGSGSGSAVTRVIAELSESAGSLSIEDVLPFIPDFATIDEFKEEICAALQGYSDKVARYKDDLAEADLVCEGLEEEIGWLEKQEVKVGENETCAISGKRVEGEDSYCFRSGFVVRVEEMRKLVWEVLNEEQRERVEWLEKELRGEGEEEMLDGEKMAELTKELDGLIAAECPCTGDLMIESVGVPLEGWNDEGLGGQ